MLTQIVTTHGLYTLAEGISVRETTAVVNIAVKSGKRFMTFLRDRDRGVVAIDVHSIIRIEEVSE